MPEFEYEYGRHSPTGWNVARLTCHDDAGGPGLTQIEIAPEEGCNLLSFRVDEQDYIVALGEGQRLLGTPILYPMPNRVRDGCFTFGGRRFAFQPNNGPNYIHGLVRDKTWDIDDPVLGQQQASLTARYRMAPGEPAYERFPIRNTLEVTFVLRPGTLSYRFVVRNDDAESALPFGLAIHPYFPIIGERADVRLWVPARAHMAAEDLLPTGELEPLDGSPYDLRRPRSLEGLDIDDVYWGLTPSRPQVIYYDRIGKMLTLEASELFTHSVVYTPAGQPFFCVENQSCSTDAHNLHAQGLEEAAHLTILPPGRSLSARIDLRLGDQ
jgi:aldose 1-epimerase